MNKREAKKIARNRAAQLLQNDDYEPAMVTTEADRERWKQAVADVVFELRANLARNPATGSR